MSSPLSDSLGATKSPIAAAPITSASDSVSGNSPSTSGLLTSTTATHIFGNNMVSSGSSNGIAAVFTSSTAHDGNTALSFLPPSVSGSAALSSAALAPIAPSASHISLSSSLPLHSPAVNSTLLTTQESLRHALDVFLEIHLPLLEQLGDRFYHSVEHALQPNMDSSTVATALNELQSHIEYLIDLSRQTGLASLPLDPERILNNKQPKRENADQKPVPMDADTNFRTDGSSAASTSATAASSTKERVPMTTTSNSALQTTTPMEVVSSDAQYNTMTKMAQDAFEKRARISEAASIVNSILRMPSPGR